jgi:hypothetical protein
MVHTGFALVSLGEQAQARPLLTPACGTYNGSGALTQDTDCAMLVQKGAGPERSADHDCGIKNPDDTYSHTDRDCATISHVVGGENWYHADNDCALVPPDDDCGLQNGFGGSTWDDHGV